MDEDLWAAYDRMGLSFQEHAADSAFNAHFDRPADLESSQCIFWREPLSALCAAATDTGFLIEKLIEPIPAESMRERYPEDYERLSKEPGFLILRLLKPAALNPSTPSSLCAAASAPPVKSTQLSLIGAMRDVRDYRARP